MSDSSLSYFLVYLPSLSPLPPSQETAGNTRTLLYLNAQKTQMLLISEPDFLLLRRTCYNFKGGRFLSKAESPMISEFASHLQLTRSQLQGKRKSKFKCLQGRSTGYHLWQKHKHSIFIFLKGGALTLTETNKFEI